MRDLRERWRSETFWGIVAACFLLQSALLLVIGAHTITQNVRQHAAVDLEIRSKATPQEIQDAYATLLNLPSVAHVTYFTQEQAYERERKEHPELVAFLEEFKLTNPFPETFVVTLHSATEIQGLIALMRNERWQQIVDTTSLSSLAGQEEELQDLLRMSTTGLALALGFFVLTGFLLICILRILLQSCSQRFSDEATTQKLLGAPALPILCTTLGRIDVILATTLAISGAGMSLLLGFLIILPDQTSALPALSTSLFVPFGTCVLLEIFLSPVMTLCCIWRDFPWKQYPKKDHGPSATRILR
jgi:cell division protein FtsX